MSAFDAELVDDRPEVGQRHDARLSSRMGCAVSADSLLVVARGDWLRAAVGWSGQAKRRACFNPGPA